MNPFYLFKALVVGVVDALRGGSRGASSPKPCRRRMDFNSSPGKAFLVAAVLALVVFAGWRIHSSFQSEAPAWLKSKSMTGPKLCGGVDPDLTWNQFVSLLEACRRESQKRKVPLGPVRFLQLQADNRQSLLWITEALSNPGFNPLSRVERQAGRMKEADLVGYYTMEGQPVRIELRNASAKTRGLVMTLCLAQPLAPGDSEWFLRVERQPGRVNVNKKGETEVFLGRLPKPDKAIQGWGVRWPEGATGVRRAPEIGAVALGSGRKAVGWINSRLETNPPPLRVTYVRAP